MQFPCVELRVLVTVSGRRYNGHEEAEADHEEAHDEEATSAQEGGQEDSWSTVETRVRGRRVLGGQPQLPLPTETHR